MIINNEPFNYIHKNICKAEKLCRFHLKICKQVSSMVIMMLLQIKKYSIFLQHFINK